MFSTDHTVVYYDKQESTHIQVELKVVPGCNWLACSLTIHCVAASSAFNSHGVAQCIWAQVAEGMQHKCMQSVFTSWWNKDHHQQGC